MKTADICAYATAGFPAKWRQSLRNKRKKSILMTFRFPNLVNASDWLCCVGNFLPPIRSTIQIWVVWNFYACSSEVISRWNHWWYRGMAAVFLGIVAGHVEEKRSIWIRYCNLNVLGGFFLFFFFTFCLFVKNWRWRFWRNNGYRITTEIHSFKWCIQTGKSWFFKFGCFFFPFYLQKA